MGKKVLVTGGTGRLGRALVPRLLAAGHEVRVLTRRERGPATGRHPHAWSVGDLRTGRGLGEAVAGVDVIVHLATTNGRADVAATRRLLEAAREAGTEHFVYVSIVGVDRSPLGYYRAKLACERLVEASGSSWTILRTTQFHDLVTDLCDAQRWSPVTIVPSNVSLQPVDVTEVADRLVAITAGPPSGRAPDLGGPQVRGLADLARTYLSASGRRRPVWPIRLPGKAMRSYRAGDQLTPDRAVGRITFEDFLVGNGVRPESVRRRLLRSGLGFLAISQLVVGLWALFAPAAFFALEVVGMGMAYNSHLMRDYGAMTLASAVVLGAAAVRMGRWLTRTALVMYATWAIPHFLVHLTLLHHLAPTTAVWLMTALGFAVALPISLLFLTAREP